jgi:hypothetical protein
MSIQITFIGESPDNLRQDIVKFLNIDSSNTGSAEVTQPGSVMVTSDTPGETVQPVKQKRNTKKTETPPPVATLEPAPTPPPVAANPFADTPAPAAMSFDDFKKACNKLIEVIPGNEGFDKASELLKTHAGVLMVKEVKPEQYASVAAAFDAAIAEYKTAKAA